MINVSIVGLSARFTFILNFNVWGVKVRGLGYRLNYMKHFLYMRYYFNQNPFEI